ncbi:hypothetical protein [Sphingomicrobium arenosum]|uniref:hypothetical protein n=1 Tax=Sphingomicrobium arenosum TaxID=2233861 RepID=UPI002240FFF3|nr:hypothetical protein [Sphingomicrobium arenosum]
MNALIKHVLVLWTALGLGSCSPVAEVTLGGSSDEMTFELCAVALFRCNPSAIKHFAIYEGFSRWDPDQLGAPLWQLALIEGEGVATITYGQTPKGYEDSGDAPKLETDRIYHVRLGNGAADDLANFALAENVIGAGNAVTVFRPGSAHTP